MRISEWSSDVCSSDLLVCAALRMNSATWASLPASACTAATTGSAGPDRITRNTYDNAGRVTKVETAVGTTEAANEEIERASCKDRRVSVRVGLGGRRFSNKTDTQI